MMQSNVLFERRNTYDGHDRKGKVCQMGISIDEVQSHKSAYMIKILHSAVLGAPNRLSTNSAHDDDEEDPK